MHRLTLMPSSTPALDELRLQPFVSLLLLMSEEEAASLDEVEQLIRGRASRQNAKLLADGLSNKARLKKAAPGLEDVRAFVYQRSGPPSWGPESGFVAQTPLLVVMLRHKDVVAVASSANDVRNAVFRAADRGDIPLHRVSGDVLETAFLKGDIRRFWMGPGHQPRRNRPRSRSSSGDHLEDTLGPADQGYVLAAAETTLTEETVVGDARRMGLGLRRSTVWTQRASWTQFVRAADRLLNEVRRVAHDGRFTQRFPVFAKRATDLTTAARSWDIEFDEPLLPPEADDAQELREEHDFLVNSVIEVRPTEGTTAHLVIGPNAAEAAVVAVVPELIRSHVEFDLRVVRASDPEFVVAFRAAFDRADKTLFYESGHIVNSDGPFEEYFDDIPFTNWEFDAFDGFDIGVEKPAASEPALAALTASAPGSSLFGWVIRHFSEAWLYGDDRADELADFIAVGATGCIDVIHVKKATVTERSKISAVPYQEVSSQVQKNAPTLSIPRLIAAVEARVRDNAAGPLWFTGSPSMDYDGFLDALSTRPASGQLRARIIQPHVSDVMIEQARAKAAANPSAAGTGDAGRLRRLDQLLNDTAASASSVGATLWVIGRLAH